MVRPFRVLDSTFQEVGAARIALQNLRRGDNSRLISAGVLPDPNEEVDTSVQPEPLLEPETTPTGKVDLTQSPNSTVR